MKKFLLITLIITLFVSTGFCTDKNVKNNQKNFYAFVQPQLLKNDWQVDGLLGYKHAFVFSSVMENYYQVIVGPYYKPNKNIALAIGVGVEDNKDIYRFGAYAQIGPEDLNVIYSGGYGGSGYAHRIEGTFMWDEYLGLGMVHFQPNNYYGPKIQLNYLNLQFNAAFLSDNGAWVSCKLPFSF